MKSFSIAIRTLGRAGMKYQKLLDSIANSKLKPEKVVVVLPHGYELPKERLGWEEFVYCEKSMIKQRIEALKYITSEYILFLDDDVSFDEDFIEKLITPLENNLFDCSTGPLFSFFPASILGTRAGTLTASVSLSLFNRDMYVKILRSGGWSYHTFDTSVRRYYPTESFAWTCFMIKTHVMKAIKMEDEIIWLEKYGYAAGDDRVMAYKLVKKGYSACIVSDAIYEHNDAKTSTSKEEMADTKPVFCMAYMHRIFWQRFIQDMEDNNILKVINSICLLYWKYMMYLYRAVKALKADNKVYATAFKRGIAEAEDYIASKEYINLPQVK